MSIRSKNSANLNMISRTPITCCACTQPITARIQVGYELEQPVNFPCPHCGTAVRLTLILDEPPKVKIRWDENAKPGDTEGKIVNIGAGFTIREEMLNQDFYFPSFDVPRMELKVPERPEGHIGPLMFDIGIASGTLRYAGEKWRTLQRAMRFNRTGQLANRDAQLKIFWEDEPVDDPSLDNALFNFLLRFLAPNSEKWLEPLGRLLNDAHTEDAGQFRAFVDHYDADLKAERFETYSDIFSEYFKAYTEFDQTLLYVRSEMPVPEGTIATSSDFDGTKMYYGNAFEVLGSHLDVVAALNNILSGRPFDQMKAMDLKHYRTINKANRTTCFADNAVLSWLVTEYDSTIRNASHHRWFKLNNARTSISYRSGGTGAAHQVSYAEYLWRCNRLTVQLMMLACLELIILSTSGLTL